MPPVGFEPTISTGERPQTHDLDRAPTGTGSNIYLSNEIKIVELRLINNPPVYRCAPAYCSSRVFATLLCNGIRHFEKKKNARITLQLKPNSIKQGRTKDRFYGEHNRGSFTGRSNTRCDLASTSIFTTTHPSNSASLFIKTSKWRPFTINAFKKR